MRHRSIHADCRVDLKVMLGTVQRDMPELVALIEPLVPPAGEM